MRGSQTLRVGEVAGVFNGKTPSKAQQRDAGHSVLKIKDVDALGRFRGTFSGHVDPELAQKHTKQQIRGGETLILNAAHSATHVASKTFYTDGEVTGSMATGEWLMIRWNEKGADPRYGHHWINTPQTRFRIRQLVNGIHLYPKDVARLQIPLPPLAEQKRIAAILDAADALRAKRRESIEELDQLVQSTFLEMFGDPVTNPMGWEMGSLGELAENEDGKRVPVKKADREQMAGEFPYYGASGVIDSVDNYLFDGDRLLIGEDGANLVARATPVAFIAKGKYWVNNHAHVLAYNGRAELIFLEAMINLVDLEPYLSGTAQPKLNQKSLNRIPIPIPPLDLQHRFASIVESVEQQKAAHRNHLEELDTLFAALQQRAFQGEL